MTFDYEHAMRVADSLLQENTHKRWGIKQFVARLQIAMGRTSPGPITAMVKGMAASQNYGGFISGRGGQIYAKPQETYHNNQQDQDSTGNLREALRDVQAHLIKTRERIVTETARAEAAEAACKEAEENAGAEYIIEVQLLEDDKVVKKIPDTYHAIFEDLLTLGKAREEIFLYGPTGCGKSYICQQLATALNLPFAFVNCTAGMSEGVIGGNLLPTGDSGKFEYVISEFVKVYENGGVFLLDEIDAADDNVLLFINNALANGRCAISKRTEKPYAERHPDFICVAAANTFGTGADRMYSGRNKLDTATLDRFGIGKLVMGYDARVEQVLCPDDELRRNLTQYRKGIVAHRLERAMSTRFMQKAYKMKSEYDWDQEKIDTRFFAGWREDEINKVKAYCD
jgi:cobaltochelatase CobS